MRRRHDDQLTGRAPEAGSHGCASRERRRGPDDLRSDGYLRWADLAGNDDEKPGAERGMASQACECIDEHARHRAGPRTGGDYQQNGGVSLVGLLHARGHRIRGAVAQASGVLDVRGQGGPEPECQAVIDDPPASRLDAGLQGVGARPIPGRTGARALLCGGQDLRGNGMVCHEQQDIPWGSDVPNGTVGAQRRGGRRATDTRRERCVSQSAPRLAQARPARAGTGRGVGSRRRGADLPAGR